MAVFLLSILISYVNMSDRQDSLHYKKEWSKDMQISSPGAFPLKCLALPLDTARFTHLARFLAN